MPNKDVMSWKTVLNDYASNGAGTWMLVDENAAPNDATLVNVLSACARLGALDLGKWVHACAESHGYKGNVMLGML
ncbi:hypothetical protein NC653_025324 [Populus alba x Populus x berolinensis]|uniref:Uncharacterized protein n=1 Tax=Populus alba x Populus x berolinensis TaxID=444605 RepID=A0AAD6Q8W9_9ROSI|nr:hypothetical protein NC653_025324 [Populus alba x Populus x berolinensis]